MSKNNEIIIFYKDDLSLSSKLDKKFKMTNYLWLKCPAVCDYWAIRELKTESIACYFIKIPEDNWYDNIFMSCVGKFLSKKNITFIYVDFAIKTDFTRNNDSNYLLMSRVCKIIKTLTNKRLPIYFLKSL
jgi:hypothetical protein